MKLQEFRTFGDEAWEELKTDAKTLWDEAKTVFRDTVSKFK